MRVVVQHRSRYHYPRPALPGPQLIRLRPADHTRARIESYQLLVEPERRLHWLRDPHGNRVARVTFKAGQAVSELDVLVELAVPSVPRGKLLELVTSLPPCLIGMEACSGAHHWARLFQAHGLTVRLMPPKFVAPYRLSGKRGKNDAADAAAICEAVNRHALWAADNYLPRIGTGRQGGSSR